MAAPDPGAGGSGQKVASGAGWGSWTTTASPPALERSRVLLVEANIGVARSRRARRPCPAARCGSSSSPRITPRRPHHTPLGVDPEISLERDDRAQELGPPRRRWRGSSARGSAALAGRAPDRGSRRPRRHRRAGGKPRPFALELDAERPGVLGHGHVTGRREAVPSGKINRSRSPPKLSSEERAGKIVIVGDVERRRADEPPRRPPARRAPRPSRGVLARSGRCAAASRVSGVPYGRDPR